MTFSNKTTLQDNFKNHILQGCMTIIDLGFIIYWAIIALELLDGSLMFKDYTNPILQDWNWSFLALDLLISFTGLFSLKLYRAHNKAWILFSIISLTLMFCAGLQAIAFWTLRSDYALLWWAPNLLLMLIPLIFARHLFRIFLMEVK